MILKPITTEKVVRLIEAENILVFNVERQYRKKEIKEEIEKMFNIKVEKIRVHIRGNKKFVYVKLNNKNPAIDIATKLGMI